MQVMTGKAQEVLNERRKQLAEEKDSEGDPDLLHVLLQPDQATGQYLDDETVSLQFIIYLSHHICLCCVLLCCVVVLCCVVLCCVVLCCVVLYCM